MPRAPAGRLRFALELASLWTRRANAFSHIFVDEALAESTRFEAVDEGPLQGMPVAVKDLFDVRGQPTTGCCAAIGPEPTERDAALVERLRAAGAIVIGKTNMHELAAGVTNLESACGPTRNPVDLSRMTGGSSGGSAAAVAGKAVPLSLVSDTGGSARIPASFCGVWGLKATIDRLPLGGMMSLSPEMDCVGLIADSLETLGTGWRAIADTVDDSSALTRVGVLRGGRWERCSVEVRAAIDAAAARFASDGNEARDVDGSELDDVHHVWNRIAWPSFAEAYTELMHDPALGGATAAVIRWGLHHRDERADALVGAERIRDWFASTFEDVGVLLTASTPYAAPRLDATEVNLGDGTTMDAHRGGPAWFTTAANVAGLPALSVPFARSSDGLPIGIQLIAPPDAESVLMRGGALLVPNDTEPPPLPEP